MQRINLNEQVAEKRRFYFKLVDATDKSTPESGENGGQPQISISGANYIGTDDTLIAISSGTNGSYYIELTIAEVSVAGNHLVRYKSGNTAEFEDILYVHTDEVPSLRQRTTQLTKRIDNLALTISEQKIPTVQVQEISEE